MRRLLLSILPLLPALAAFRADAQRNGMYFDLRNSYLIPLQSRDALIGHASIAKAEKISKDSNLYIVGIYDQSQARRGEYQLSLPSGYSFDCAAFDGRNIYARFTDENRAVRYIAFDQQAAVVFDTTLALRCLRTPVDKVSYYQQASVFPVEGSGIVDNIRLSGKAPAVTVRISAGGPVWVNGSLGAANTGNKILLATDRVIVEAVYRFSGGGASPGVRQTDIVILDAGTGTRQGGSVLPALGGQAFYPVNAAIVDDQVEILSEFTRQQKSFGRVKYGAAIHRLKLADGSIAGAPAINEFTTTLLRDTTLKARSLMTNSYLYISHAARSAEGHWLLAMQQFAKLPVKVRLLHNAKVSYEMRNLCFVELNAGAGLLSSHQEINPGNKVSVPAAFFYNPQNSGNYLSSKSLTDVGYFVTPDEAGRQLAFVYADLGKDRRLKIGNVQLRDGKYQVDKLTRTSGGGAAVAGLLPASLGHTYLVSFDTQSGKFSFDKLKLGN